MKSTFEKGRAAEGSALQWFLTHRPAQFLCRNYRCRVGEIDLIFLENESELVFVEVRSQEVNPWLESAKAITPRKILRLKRAISHFLTFYKGPVKTLRVDLLFWEGHRWDHLINQWLH